MRPLRRFHKQFSYYLTTKLYYLLPKLEFKAGTPETLHTIERIASARERFKRIKIDPQRFPAAVGAQNTFFNAEVYFDLMYIEQGAEFQIVDVPTNFGVA